MTRRRGTGEGSVYQLANGKWRGLVELGWRDGKRVRKYVRADTATAAKAAVLRLRTAAAAGLPPTDDRVTVGAFLAEWLLSVRSSVRSSTLRGYEQAVRLHLGPAIGSIRLAKLQPSHVDRLMAAHLAAGASPTTVRLTRNILRAALGQALRRGLVGRNVAALARPPRLVRVEIEPPSPEEARRLIAATFDDPLGIVWLVAVATGLRRGELAGLRWDDLDEARGELTVRRQVVTVGGRTEITEPKSASSRRVLVLPAPVVAALREHRRVQAHQRLGIPWIFANGVGGHLDPRKLSRGFHEAVRAAGMRPMRLHDLRHSVASFLVAGGASARHVQAQLGHSSPGFTMATYAHLFQDARQKSADTIGDALFPGTRAAAGG